MNSPLLLAPMSSIGTAAFRLLMEALGAGGTVSELISACGINRNNQKTKNMLRIDPRENMVGIQIFGHQASSMADAAKYVQELGPKFIDINMGCPVRKVVRTGAGAALLRQGAKLGQFFATIKRAIEIPLTIKIRTGWDQDSINAQEIVSIAYNEGVEFVSVHGRTRCQGHSGPVDWTLIDDLATSGPLAIVGNGELHSASAIHQRLQTGKCSGLMLGRGPLRNPFIFLEGPSGKDNSPFTPRDYGEVIEVYYKLLEENQIPAGKVLISLKKMATWFATGLPQASNFRAKVFKIDTAESVVKYSEDYLNKLDLKGYRKSIDYQNPFMAGGHG